MNIYIGLNIQWLTAKAHELGEYNWGMLYMGQVVDKLYDVCIEINKDVRKMLNKYFIYVFGRHWERYTRIQKLPGVFI